MASALSRAGARVASPLARRASLADLASWEFPAAFAARAVSTAASRRLPDGVGIPLDPRAPAHTHRRPLGPVARATRGHRGFAASPATPSLTSDVDKHVLYRGPWLLPFRTLVRFKIFQLAGVAAGTVPLTAAFNDAPMDALTLTAVVAVVGGSAACSLALQYYASRYVGELSLVRRRDSFPKSDADERRVRLSTMDFWGARVDEDVRFEDVVPPLKDLPREALAEMATQMFVPLDVVGSRQHILSLRHGHLRDKERLFALLTGRDVAELERWRAGGDATR